MIQETCKSGLVHSGLRHGANVNRDLSFHVAFNNILRVSEASGASKTRHVSQPVRGKRAGAGGPVQADRTVSKQV